MPATRGGPIKGSSTRMRARDAGPRGSGSGPGPTGPNVRPPSYAPSSRCGARTGLVVAGFRDAVACGGPGPCARRVAPRVSRTTVFNGSPVISSVARSTICTTTVPGLGPKVLGRRPGTTVTVSTVAGPTGSSTTREVSRISCPTKGSRGLA